jgi:Raf kinase inhibitor-like YbhB/YbcL family protein
MLEKLPSIVGRTLRRVRPGIGRTLINDAAFTAVSRRIIVESDAFANEAGIPPRYTADGEALSPPLRWTRVPEGTRSIVLVVEDADSPTPQPLVHAIVWNLMGGEGELDEGGIDKRRVPIGRSSSLQSKFLPIDPPPGHGRHRYAFQVFALDTPLDFRMAPGKTALLRAMRGHVLSSGALIGTYERS